jgi:protein ImuB
VGRLGLRTLGDLAALPAADVLARFGRPGLRAHRLAAGLDARPPAPSSRSPTGGSSTPSTSRSSRCRRWCSSPSSSPTELAADLAAEGRVCTRLLVEAETEHGERTERTWYRDGGMSAAAMVERVRWQLDGWVGAAGPAAGDHRRHRIVLVRLVPDEVRGDDGVQIGLWGGRSQADDDAARAITRLIGLVGDQAVRVPAWRGGRLPAERYEWVPASTADLDDPADRLASVRSVSGPDPGGARGRVPSPRRRRRWCSPSPRGRPARRLGAHPAGRWTRRGERRAGGAGGRRVRRAVTAWAGPWPVEQAWWDPRRHRRLARLQVVTDDGDAHLVAAEHRRWWLLASYR